MNVEIFTLCDAATDQLGKVSLLGAFDTLWAVQFPVVIPHCAIVLRLRLTRIESGSHRIRLNLVDEDGHSIIPPLDANFAIQINDESAASNLVLNLQNLKLEKAGRYSIDLAIDGRQEHSLPLYVKIQERPQPLH